MIFKVDFLGTSKHLWLHTSKKSTKT